MSPPIINYSQTSKGKTIKKKIITFKSELDDYKGFKKIFSWDFWHLRSNESIKFYFKYFYFFISEIFYKIHSPNKKNMKQYSWSKFVILDHISNNIYINNFTNKIAQICLPFSLLVHDRQMFYSKWKEV